MNKKSQLIVPSIGLAMIMMVGCNSAAPAEELNTENSITVAVEEYLSTQGSIITETTEEITKPEAVIIATEAATATIEENQTTTENEVIIYEADAPAEFTEEETEVESIERGEEAIFEEEEEDDDDIEEDSEDAVLGTIETGDSIEDTLPVDYDIPWVVYEVVECEVHGGDKESKIHVAHVIRNRVNSGLFPNDYYSVCTAPNQFCLRGDVEQSTIDAVNEAMTIEDTTYGALFFHSMGYQDTFCGYPYKFTDNIGHCFY